ncbi:hypothetical protein AWJ15_01265 [Lacticaseibacillus rhamnosus]|uniref:hypothetical protein n=1 Tax=Lacticaseibacillus rhamnosus TaxID=47715 RepID=UPI0009799603|nr:hypothetical protein [Lacticaseibacillus rhamnosus]AQG71679.1 hypothetical protein AWJ15_01265 [Lacticaseibacillus rhamnosus]
MSKEKQADSKNTNHQIELVDSSESSSEATAKSTFCSPSDEDFFKNLSNDLHSSFDQSGTSPSEIAIPEFPSVNKSDALLISSDKGVSKHYIIEGKGSSSNFRASITRGNHMDSKYSTKEEIKTLEAKINGQIETHAADVEGKVNTINATMNSKIELLNATINGQFDKLNTSIGDLKESIPDKVSVRISKEFNDRDKRQRDTIHYIIGTLFIGGASLIVGIISMFIH